MKRFGHVELERFLTALDEHLTAPFDLVIIGGTAASLAYQVRDATRDIDSLYSVEGLREAHEAAKDATGLDIPLETVGIWDGPAALEDRLVALEIAGLKRLRIRVPERHDLVLMKIMRADAHDLDAARQIHEREPLELERLLRLFDEEMAHVHGNKREILLNFLALVEILFAEDEARKAGKKLKDWPKK
jgi:hypothetical protein